MIVQLTASAAAPAPAVQQPPPAAEGGGTVSVGVGVVLIVAVVWVLKTRRRAGPGLAVLAFTAGVMLAGSQIGNTCSRLGAQVVTSAVAAFSGLLA